LKVLIQRQSPGDHLLVTVLNAGPTATGVVFDQPAAGGPPGLVHRNQGHCEWNEDRVVCDFGALSNALPARLTVVVAPDHFGLFTNTAVVTQDGTAGAPSNFTASAVATSAPPFLTIGDVVITEGNTGLGRADFQLTLSAPSALPASVTFLTSNGTAVAGSDYVAALGRIVIPPGSTQATVTVLINGDTTNETDETFYVLLNDSSNVSLARKRAIGVILNDDQREVASMLLRTGNPGVPAVLVATGTTNFQSQVTRASPKSELCI
jgi:hypothetical protein